MLELIERLKITSFFAPPTVWISLLRHPDFDKRNLKTLRNIYYGASIMPVPVLQELRQKLPGVRFYNCYGQTEIAPLATILKPEEHDARPGIRRPSDPLRRRRASSIPTCAIARPACTARSSIARRSS